MAQLSISLLGAFRVTLDGAPLEHFSSDKARALLAYLAADGRGPYRRETLAGLLWPGYPETSARRSLSQTLFGLRRDLGFPGEATWVQGDAKSVVFCPEGCTVDAVELASLVAACRSHPHADATTFPECLERYARAAALYTGEFMEGFTLRDAPAFEEWLLLKREEYRREVVGALDALSAPGEEHCDNHAALRYARRWLELEPLDERAHRQVMRLLVVTGQSSAALAHYEICRRMLQAELSAEPDARTTALYQQIRMGRFPAAPSRTVDLLVRPPAFLSGEERYRAPLFLARETELAALQGYLERSLAGQAQFAFVAGEAGAGKSALVQEFAHAARQESPTLVTVTGRCNAYTGIGDPYLAFREILAQLAGDVEDRWTAGAMGIDEATRLWDLLPHICLALAEAGPDLASVLLNDAALLSRAEAAAPPEAGWLEAVRALFATRTAQPTAVEVQQIALFRQYTAVLQRLAREHPLLLVLEDLHWADSGSISLLFHMGLHLAADRILIVGTFRPAELAGGGAPGERHSLEPVLHELQRRYGDVAVDLGRADGRHFVSALLDSEPNALDDNFRGALYSQAGGNPLFTTELLHAMRERGDLSPDGDGRWVVGDAVRWDRLPARVEAVIAERIGRLPAALQEILRVGSVEGETFTAEAVAHVMGVDQLAVIHDLGSGAMQRNGLIGGDGLQRHAGQQASRYRFRHILVQSYLYGSLDAAERAYLHRGVAEALETAHGGFSSDLAVTLAWHYEEAGVADRAAVYLQEAGARAAQLSAYEEAATHCSRGLGLLQSLPASDQTRSRELALRMGLAQAMQAVLGMTDPRVAREYELLRALSLELGQTPELIEALALLNSYYAISGDYASAIAIGEEATVIARRSGDPALTALAGALLGWMHYCTGNYLQSLADLAPMIALYESRAELFGQDNALAFWAGAAFTWTAEALARLGYADQGRRRVHQRLELAHRIGRHYRICQAIGGEAAYYLAVRESGTALQLANEEVRLADEKGYPTLRVMSRFHQGRALHQFGRHQEAIDLFLEAMRGAAQIGFRAFAPFYLRALGEAYTSTGRLAEARDTLERGFALALEMNEGMTLTDLYMARAALRLATDPPDADGAEADLTAAIDLARQQQARQYELRASLRLGRLWLSLGRSEEARALVHPVYDWFTEGFDTPDLVEARELLEELDPE